VPRYEPGSSVNTGTHPASWLRHAVGGPETRLWALTKQRDLGAEPCTPTASSFRGLRHQGLGLLSPHPGEAVNLCCPCFSEREERKEGTGWFYQGHTEAAAASPPALCPCPT